MAKGKKSLAMMLSAALMVLSCATVPVSAVGVTEILKSDGTGPAIWVKADTGIEEGIWRDQSGSGNDLIVPDSMGSEAVQNVSKMPDVVSDAINGKPAIATRNAAGARTFWVASYAQVYQGDSTVFVVSKFNDYKTDGSWKGYYTTGNGTDRSPAGGYEQVIMNYGKTESRGYTLSGEAKHQDRSSEAMDNTIPSGVSVNGESVLNNGFMNYSYTIKNDGNNGVNAKYQYTNRWGNAQQGEWRRCDNGEEGCFQTHYGFTLASREDIFKDDTTPNMQIAEVIVFLKTMTDEEISAVRSYLDTKYFGSGYDPFVPADYSTIKLPDQLDPDPERMPIAADDSRLALWVDGESFEGTVWKDKSSSGNDMTVTNSLTKVTPENLDGKSAVAFSGGADGGFAYVQLAQPYTGSSQIYMVYRPYATGTVGEADSKLFDDYSGIFCSSYITSGHGDSDRVIDVRHGGGGIEVGMESKNAGSAVLLWNAGRQPGDDGGSSYYGYTRGFLDFEMETTVTEENTTLNVDYKDGEGVIPSINTNTEVGKRGLNKNASSTISAGSASYHDGYTIGKRWDIGNSGLKMDVAEVIVFQGTLTQAEKAAMSTYIQNKYYKDNSDYVPPEKMLTTGVELNLLNDQGEKATGGISEAALLSAKGTINNKYCPQTTEVKIITAIYSKGKLAEISMKNINGITVDGTAFETPAMMVPSDKSDLKLKMFAVDSGMTALQPFMDAREIDISLTE